MSSIDQSKLSDIYRQRFVEKEQQNREALWDTLVSRWFQRYVQSTDTVLDLAAGYCEFINHIKCAHKIAVDLNEDVRTHANPDVEVIHAWSHDMKGVGNDSIDVVFVSNFFEHLPTKEAFLATLMEIKRVLKPAGTLLILQPNIRFLGGEYWDFVDHYLPLTDRTLVEAAGLTGLNVLEVHPQFLPFTTQSSIPQASWLVRLYLRVPLAWKIMGKQAFVVAQKPA